MVAVLAIAATAAGPAWGQTTYNVTFDGFNEPEMNTTVNVASLPQTFSQIDVYGFYPFTVISGNGSVFTSASVTSGGEGKVSVNMPTLSQMTITVSGTFEGTATIHVVGEDYIENPISRDITVSCVVASEPEPAPAPTPAEPIVCTTQDVGKVLCSDGSIYATASAASADSKTAVAMIVYIDTTNMKGLALALADEGQMDWSNACTACSTTKNTNTPVTGATWILASREQWTNMITAAGSYTALRDGFESVGGVNMLQAGDYWSSTESGSSKAWYYRFGSGSWSYISKTISNVCYARASLEFDITLPPVPITVRMAEGTEEAGNWSIASGNESVQGTQVLENVMAGDSLVVTAPASLNRKVKSVKAVKYVPPVLVESIVLDKQTAFLAKDSTMTLSVASVLPENAADKSYTWSSDATGVATVNENGVVTGVAGGTANIIATANDGSGVKDTCVVTVLSSVTIEGVTVLYASEDDTWADVMGYNPGLMYQDGDYNVRLNSNDAFLFYEGYPVEAIGYIYPSAYNDYQWVLVTEISGRRLLYRQGETWQQAISANRPGSQNWSIVNGQVKYGERTLVDTNDEPVDPTATIDPSTVEYDLELIMDN